MGLQNRDVTSSKKRKKEEKKKKELKDSEVAEAFEEQIQELTCRLQGLKHDMNMLNMKISENANQVKRQVVVIKEVEALFVEVPVWKKVGRMFLLNSRDSMLRELEAEKNLVEGEVPRLRAQEAQLTIKSKDVANSISEILKAQERLRRHGGKA